MIGRNFVSLYLAIAAAVIGAVEGLQPSESSSSRRDFLNQASASVLTGATAPLWIPGVATAESTAATPSTLPIKLPPIGLGCWAWGDSLFWGYNPKQDSD